MEEIKHRASLNLGGNSEIYVTRYTNVVKIPRVVDGAIVGDLIVSAIWHPIEFLAYSLDYDESTDEDRSGDKVKVTIDFIIAQETKEVKRLLRLLRQERLAVIIKDLSLNQYRLIGGKHEFLSHSKDFKTGSNPANRNQNAVRLQGLVKDSYLYEGEIALKLVPPSAPGSFQAIPVSSTEIALSWKAPPERFTSYVLQRSTSADFSTDLVEVLDLDLLDESYSDSSLEISTLYYYRLFAVLGVLNGGFSLENAETFAITTLTTNWNASSAADGAYTLTVTSLTGNVHWKLGGEAQTGNTFTIPVDSPLLDGTDKTITLEAPKNELINSTWSNKKLKGIIDFSLFTSIQVVGILEGNSVEGLDLTGNLTLRQLSVINNLINEGITFPETNEYFNLYLDLTIGSIANNIVDSLSNLTGGYSQFLLKTYNVASPLPTGNFSFPTLSNPIISGIFQISVDSTDLDLSSFDLVQGATTIRNCDNLVNLTNNPAHTQLLIVSVPVLSTNSINNAVLSSASSLNRIYIANSNSINSIDFSLNDNIIDCYFENMSNLTGLLDFAVNNNKVRFIFLTGMESYTTLTLSKLINLKGGFSRFELHRAPTNIAEIVFSPTLIDPNCDYLLLRTSDSSVDLSMFDSITQFLSNGATTPPNLLSEIITDASWSIPQGGQLLVANSDFADFADFEIGTKSTPNVINAQDCPFTTTTLADLIDDIDLNKANFAAVAKVCNVGGSLQAVPDSSTVTKMTNLAASDTWTFTYFNGSNNVVIT